MKMESHSKKNYKTPHKYMEIPVSPSFKEKLTSVLPKVFHKIEKEGRLLSSSYKARNTLRAKVYKDTQRKETNYRAVSLMNTDARILKEILTSQVQEHINKTMLISFQRHRARLTNANQDIEFST